MAVLKYTFGRLKALVAHFLGRSPDSRIYPGEIVNQAIDWLWSYHSWSWKTVITTLNFQSNTAQIALPSDFGELKSLYPYSVENLTTLRPAQNLEQLMAARLNAVAGSSEYVYRIAGASQGTNTADVPTRVLEIAPAPAADVDDALYLVYDQAAPAYDASGTNDDSVVIPIPAGFQRLLWPAVSAWAELIEDGKAGVAWQTAQLFLDQAKAQDAASQPLDVGPIRGAVDEIESLDDSPPPSFTLTL